MSKDTIYREDAIKAYNEAMEELVKWQMEEWQLGDFSECEFNTTDCKHIARKIEAIPSADRPQGKWFKDNEGTFICSACGSGYKDQPTIMGKPMFKWCPLCGTKMKGADDGNK